MCGPFLPGTTPGYTALLRLAKLLEPGPRASTGGPCSTGGPFLMCGAYSLRAYTGDYKAFGLRGFGRRIFATPATCATTRGQMSPSHPLPPPQGPRILRQTT